MTSTTVMNFSDNLPSYLDRAVLNRDVISINTTHGNAIVLSEDEYNSLMETVYLLGIPGMRAKLSEGIRNPLEECDEFEWYI